MGTAQSGPAHAGQRTTTALVTTAAVTGAAAGAALGAALMAHWLKVGERHPPLHCPAASAKRIILVRHGESEGNVDTAVYQSIPDWKVPLTTQGHQQAWEAGVKLKSIIGDDPVIAFVSPYRRTRQTLLGIIAGMEGAQAGSDVQNAETYDPCATHHAPGTDGPTASERAMMPLPRPGSTKGCNLVMVREEPRLREQDFGNFQRSRRHSTASAERREYGKFFFRLPEGESGADVYDRVTSFFDSLHRVFRYTDFHPDTSVIIVTHGVTLRCFLMRWFRWSVHTFESSANPGNAAFVQMKRVGETYRLTHASADIIGLTGDTAVQRRMLPAEAPLATPALCLAEGS